MRKLDCAGLSALTRAVMTARGEHASAVQLILASDDCLAAQWRSLWEKAGLAASWITPDVMYHEAVGIHSTSSAIKVWDPSSSQWIYVGSYAVDRAVRALRIVVYEGGSSVVAWGDVSVPAGTWVAPVLSGTTSGLVSAVNPRPRVKPSGMRPHAGG